MLLSYCIEGILLVSLSRLFVFFSFFLSFALFYIRFNCLRCALNTGHTLHSFRDRTIS